MPAVRTSPRRRLAAAAFALALIASACASNEDDAQDSIDGGSAQTDEPSASSEGTEAESQPDAVAAESEGDGSQPAATEPEAAEVEEAEVEQAAEQDPLFFGEFASLEGASVNLADYAGQDVVLWFWAPW